MTASSIFVITGIIGVILILFKAANERWRIFNRIYISCVNTFIHRIFLQKEMRKAKVTFSTELLTNISNFDKHVFQISKNCFSFPDFKERLLRFPVSLVILSDPSVDMECPVAEKIVIKIILKWNWCRCWCCVFSGLYFIMYLYFVLLHIP